MVHDRIDYITLSKYLRKAKPYNGYNTSSHFLPAYVTFSVIQYTLVSTLKRMYLQISTGENQPYEKIQRYCIAIT